MVLCSKEIFLQLKSLSSMYVNVMPQPFAGQAGQIGGIAQQWQLVIQGITDTAPNGMGMPDLQLFVNCDSKEAAYNLFSTLIKQVVDSGEIPAMNEKLLDDVLTNKEE